MKKIIFILCTVSISAIHSQQLVPLGNFLEFTPDAKAIGTGNSGVATEPDNYSIYWNSAKQTFNNSKMGISATYVPTGRYVLPDLNYYSAAGFYKINNRIVLMAAARHFSHGKISITDISGNLMGTVKAAESALDFSTSYKITRVFSSAITLRYINSSTGFNTESLSTYNNQVVAGDISFFRRDSINFISNPSVLSFGLNIVNIGKAMKVNEYEFYQPTSIKAGTALKTDLSEKYSLTLSADGIIPMKNYSNSGLNNSNIQDRYVNISSGIQLSYNDNYFLRGGYFTRDELYANGNTSFASAGIGLKYKSLGIDISACFDTKNTAYSDAAISLNLIL